MRSVVLYGCVLNLLMHTYILMCVYRGWTHVAVFVLCLADSSVMYIDMLLMEDLFLWKYILFKVHDYLSYSKLGQEFHGVIVHDGKYIKNMSLCSKYVCYPYFASTVCFKNAYCNLILISLDIYMAIQCENGHIACSSCCTTLVNKCPICCSKIGYRNRAIEKVLETTKVKCKFAKYGCNEALNYNKKRDHEKRCSHVSCFCPLTDCDFTGSSSQLYQHFSNEHKNSAVQFLYNNCFGITLKATDQYHILQEKKDGILFILNNSKGNEHLGNAITITCIAPMSIGSSIPYDISASSMSGLYTVKFESSSTFSSRKQDDKPSTGFLVVPSYFFSSEGQFKLDVCIFRSSVDRRIKVKLF